MYEPDARVRVIIPEPTDPDHRYHGEVGQIVAIRRSGLAAATCDRRDALLYRVAFDEPRGDGAVTAHQQRRPVERVFHGRDG